MIIIRFPDEGNKRQALGFVAKRFPFTTWATGELMVPEAALPILAAEGFRFSVEGRPTYEQLVFHYRGRR